MAILVNPSSKFERAVRQLFVLEGVGTMDNTRLGNDSNLNSFPNRKFVVTAFNPTKPYRPEGWCSLEIQHFFQGVEQPNDTPGSARAAIDAYVGDSLDLLNFAGTSDQNMSPLADAITKAGRWLATPDPAPPDADAAAQSALIVSQNSDMAYFRCDEVKFGAPQITRGHPEAGATHWVEIIHLAGRISHSTTALPN